MSHGEGRLRDAPGWLLWSMEFINRIGFPIAVSIYLGYMQLKALPRFVDSLNAVNATLQEVRKSIDNNTASLNQNLRRSSRDR